ncbi:MAG: helix-turn-helix transcriptional regulator [Crocinitomicaceae bacterium]|nr:helix-turn-helix transcriptional regulator [Crocinitomicaceae bacterium]MCB0838356.1 helix-turn-helix transcriptional regulator [Bacteroidota bacterium]
MKKYTLNQIKNKFIGEEGTPKRDAYEFELNLDLVGEMIKTARVQRNLTQADLGKLVGVQKAQISKLENGATNVRIDTIIKVFNALKAKINFRVELLDQKINLVG